ncbi:MAG: acetyl-CoA carboxylase biotin carboxylase subunit [Bacillota bacterium]
MFKKVLIANRGEIAVRIIRACRELGIKAVAIYPEEDRDSLHVKYADEAYSLGAGNPAKAYLEIPGIIDAAAKSGADAIHPGYGFLSENPFFAAVCAAWRIGFIGPTAPAMQKIGEKVPARDRMIRLGVPIVPGTDGIIESADEARQVAERIGYPVLVKATAGGGGRGIRVVRAADELEAALQKAADEAGKLFGNAGVYIEKYLVAPRHIEFQILADHHGHVIHLGERDSSIQRRRQKILEESPSSAMTPALRQEMGEAAVRVATSVGYTNAGTVEFLLDNDGHYYFLEMNARIQVEHPVTEAVTGIDIVREQFRLGAGEPLGYQQGDVELTGWAIECRVNAEDPDNDFRPSPGRITDYREPSGPGIRVDGYAGRGYEVPAYYDSLLAKIIAWDRDRPRAIARMRRALDECVVGGIKTTIPLHKRILDSADFRAGRTNTGFLENGGFMGSPSTLAVQGSGR